MARSHGKILVGVWIDPDFVDLTPMEQWAYFMLLSQPKLNLVGCIDYQPARWAHLAADTTAEDIEAVMGGLEVAGFVCIDRETGELLIRSMTKHDGLRTNNPKLMKGLWGAWTGIASPMLRAIAVDNMPDALLDGDVPEAAERLRRSRRTDCSIGNAITTESNRQSDARSFRLPPSTILHPPSADAHSQTQSGRQPMPEGWLAEARTEIGA